MHNIHSLSEFHQLLSIAAPLHPLVSIVKVSELHAVHSEVWSKFTTTFYTVSLKSNIQSKIKYGQNYYDFDSGSMIFTSPKQVQSVEAAASNMLNKKAGTGYVLSFHPDFLANHPLAVSIRKYNFFSYAVSEALHISEKEKKIVTEIFKQIEEEYQHIDYHTQNVIVSQIDLLLTYCQRFYERQFITRRAVNNDLLTKAEQIINHYYDNEKSLELGILTVEYLANQLHLTSHYLSDALRSLTGMSAQQHIHQKLIEKAKEYLTSTNLTVSEIAYNLGFERSQSFNKLFKKKTNISPLEFKQSFN